MDANDKLRVSFIVGALNKGGAEKQFVYMLRALNGLGAELQVLTLTQGEFHEESLAELGIRPIYLGTRPPERMANILKATAAFRPHFLQASHFFAGIYAGLAGRLAHIPSIGAIRSDWYLDKEGLGSLADWAIRLPSVLLANSYNARQNALQAGVRPERLFVVQNVIDLQAFDQRLAQPPSPAIPGADTNRIRVVTVARLVAIKRLERFLQALAIARRQVPELEGVIVGSGPEENGLRALAMDLGLLASPRLLASRDGKTHPLRAGVRFLGERDDIAEILGQCDVCVMTSDREGFPNILLEAMAARLPILATPAGEAPQIVQEGLNGYRIPFDDIPVLAGYLVQLAQAPAERRQMGEAGRELVEALYDFPQLRPHLHETYSAIARQLQNHAALAALRHMRRWVQAPGSHFNGTSSSSQIDGNQDLQNKDLQKEKLANSKATRFKNNKPVFEPRSTFGTDAQDESTKLGKG